MNNCNFVGEVYFKRPLEKDYNSEDILRFILKVPRGKDKGFEFIECEAFSSAARAIAEETRLGDYLAVTAKCRTTTWETPDGPVKKQRFQTLSFTFVGAYCGK